MPSKAYDIIVVGTSAGGLEALDSLVGQLPTDLAATMFIVQHMAPANSGDALIRRLGRHRAFDVKLAAEGERFKPGRIYIAPPTIISCSRARRRWSGRARAKTAAGRPSIRCFDRPRSRTESASSASCSRVCSTTAPLV